MPRLTREQALAELQELYDSLPALECKGRCWDTCTVIDASELERERMRERGVELPAPPSSDQLRAMIASGKVPRCPALSPLNTCSVYDVRPLICRAFGMVREPGWPLVHSQPMMCDHGCIPDGTIPPAELYRALHEIEVLSQQVTGVRRGRFG